MSNRFWKSLSVCLDAIFFDDTHTQYKDHKDQVFMDACKNGNTDIVDVWLMMDIVEIKSPIFDDTGPICEASTFGNVEVVDRLLQYTKKRLMVDPPESKNVALMYAINNGHINVVDRLLQDDRVDPSSHDNIAFRLACNYNGHINVVDRLLQDDRVDPLIFDNYTARLAAAYSNIAIFDRLIQINAVRTSFEKSISKTSYFFCSSHRIKSLLAHC